ncbi:MAG: hypothetical protein HYZ92_07235, partial [Candidatus Omnitrophica bacterium]|nr:hypothetical protein [Candidatus Omnitrophota bacterium]
MMDYVPTTVLHGRVSRLSRHELRDRLHAVRALSVARGLRFLDGQSRPQTIELALLPWILTPVQLRFFGQLARHLADALMRLPVLYARHPAIRQILPLDPAQESWVRLAAHPRSRPFAVMGRLDSTTTFDRAAWRRGVQFLEPNAVGVGGVHYAPTACSIVLDVLGDLLTAAFPTLKLVPTPDPRQLLVEELAHVAGRLGRRLRRVALLENAEFTTGMDEFGQLARHLSQHGLQALVVDPRDLRLSSGRLTAEGREIDLIYRDCELNEFIDMEAGGSRLTALRRAIQEGRLVSGLLWEFDQKSAWEVFTDPVWSRHFTPGQRRVFRAYLPWTRLVR